MSPGVSSGGQRQEMWAECAENCGGGERREQNSAVSMRNDGGWTWSGSSEGVCDEEAVPNRTAVRSKAS